MNNSKFGLQLLAELKELEVQLMHGGRKGLLSLIEACIEQGWRTEKQILAKVSQLSGPSYEWEVRKLLQTHASSLGRPQLWQLESGGFYSTLSVEWDPESMPFWKPARDTDLAAC